MAGQRTVRDLNQQALMRLFGAQDGRSRAQLARTLGLTKATVSAIVADLLDQDLLVERGMTAVSDRGGRPGTTLALNPRGASILGAEFSESHVAVVGLRLDGSQIGQTRVDLEPGIGLPAILDELCRLVDGFRTTHVDDLPNLTALGLALPGMLAPDGTVTWFPGLHWPPGSVAGRLEDRIGLDVVVENDANASAMAELLLGSEVADSFLYLLLDRGVGSSIVVDRSLYRGADGRSGEVGHMRLALDGPVCPHCGATGCYESMVNTDAIERYYRQASGRDVDWPTILATVEQDEHARQAFDRWVWWLARGLLNLVYVLNPAHIVVGGVIPHLVPHLGPILTDAMTSEAFGAGDGLTVRLSTWGEAQGAIGAAAIIRRQFFTAASSVMPV